MTALYLTRSCTVFVAAYIYIRGEFYNEASNLQMAIKEVTVLTDPDSFTLLILVLFVWIFASCSVSWLLGCGLQFSVNVKGDCVDHVH